jgi:hypothetical protein
MFDLFEIVLGQLTVWRLTGLANYVVKRGIYRNTENIDKSKERPSPR